MIFDNVQAVVDKLEAELAVSAPGVQVVLGKPRLAEHVGASARVGVVPTTGRYIPGSNRDDFGTTVGKIPIVATNVQRLEIHCWARAAKNVALPGRQYGDDLRVAELVRAKVLAVALKFFEGPAAGGDMATTEHGENADGVELVVTIPVELAQRDSPLELASDDTVFEQSGQIDFPAGPAGSCE